MDDGNIITITANSSGSVTTTDGQWSNSYTYVWICQTCGGSIGAYGACSTCGTFTANSQWPVYSQNSSRAPHRCPVCEGRGRVLFDPDNPFKRSSSVEHWACKPCSGSGILWG